MLNPGQIYTFPSYARLTTRTLFKDVRESAVTAKYYWAVWLHIYLIYVSYVNVSPGRR